MFLAGEKRKCLILGIALMLSAGIAGGATGKETSCDIEKICKMVKKAKKEAKGKAEKPSDTKKNEQLFDDTKDYIENECGLQMAVPDEGCEVEQVIKLCWDDTEIEPEHCWK